MASEQMHPLKEANISPLSFNIDDLTIRDEISKEIGIRKEALDWTIHSLSELDKYFQAEEKSQYMNLSILLPVSLYFGEVFRKHNNGQWKIKKAASDKSVWEPSVKIEGSTMEWSLSITPHEIFMFQLSSENGFSLHRAAIQFSEEVLNLQSVFATDLDKPYWKSAEFSTAVTELMESLSNIDFTKYMTPEIYRRVNAWLFSAYQYFLHFGFFSKEAFSSAEETTSFIKKAMINNSKVSEEIKDRGLYGFYLEFVEIEQEEKVGFDFPYKSFFLSSSMLKADTSRVWTYSEATNSEEEKQYYLKLLNRWSEVSRGSFLPKNISVEQDESHLFTVKFTICDEVQEFPAEEFGREREFCAIKKINRCLFAKNERYSFFALPVFMFDDYAIVSFSEQERKQFSKDRILACTPLLYRLV